MAGKTRPMSQIKQLLQLYKQGMKLNTIARSLGISRNTVKSYLQKLSLLKVDIDTLLSLDDPILEVRFHAGNPAYLDGRFEYFKSCLAYYESELKRKHVTRIILWQEYRLEQPQTLQTFQTPQTLQTLQTLQTIQTLQTLQNQSLFADQQASG